MKKLIVSFIMGSVIWCAGYYFLNSHSIPDALIHYSYAATFRIKATLKDGTEFSTMKQKDEYRGVIDGTNIKELYNTPYYIGSITLFLCIGLGHALFLKLTAKKIVRCTTCGTKYTIARNNRCPRCGSDVATPYNFLPWF